ncbi:MAG: hypothetical protein EOO82_02290 [Oxalobacteraceae bacterium]|nr:MAG: hypothetical protein EOO82_02290 [Oxalobacteraceae bacterium]
MGKSPAPEDLAAGGRGCPANTPASNRGGFSMTNTQDRVRRSGSPYRRQVVAYALAGLTTASLMSTTVYGQSVDLSQWSPEYIKSIAGTATYDNAFDVPKVTKNASYILDLGEVKNIAEVIVNGKIVGTVWKKPFRIDITPALKTGRNTVQIKVTNLWVNRLIGDAQPAVNSKITFTTMPFYRADSPLLPSGLLGPVRVLEATPASVAVKR